MKIILHDSKLNLCFVWMMYFHVYPFRSLILKPYTYCVNEHKQHKKIAQISLLHWMWKLKALKCGSMQALHTRTYIRQQLVCSQFPVNTNIAKKCQWFDRSHAENQQTFHILKLLTSNRMIVGYADKTVELAFLLFL